MSAIPDTNGTFEVRRVGRTSRVEVVHYPDPAEERRMRREWERATYFEWAKAYLLGDTERKAAWLGLANEVDRAAQEDR